MKTITIDDELYALIASQTKHIGEGASDILRRILIDELRLNSDEKRHVDVTKPKEVTKAVRDINKSKQLAQQKAMQEANKVVEAGDFFALLKQQTFRQPMSKVERFLMMLGALHSAHKDKFDVVLDIKGKGRLYFAKDKSSLIKTGSSTNPKPIPESNYWVVTNNNTDKKCAMLLSAAQKLGYSDSNVERLGKLFKE